MLNIYINSDMSIYLQILIKLNGLKQVFQFYIYIHVHIHTYRAEFCFSLLIM